MCKSQLKAHVPPTLGISIMIKILIADFAGTLAIVASILDWDWFFENWRAAFFVKLFGRGGARVFYASLGLAIISIAHIYIICAKSQGL
jgi:hypothetical protein